MANLTLQQLMHPQVIFETVINRVKPTNNTLQRFWGIQLGTKNVQNIQGRAGSYDIFDSVRTIANFRAPLAPPASIPPQVVHSQPVSCARIYEKMPLLYEHIFPLRKMGRPSTEVDPGGAEYTRRQEGILRTRFDNAREILTAGMMRGTIQILISGENWSPVFSGGTFTIDWQVAASNKSQILSSITSANCIASTWLNVNNATVFEDILAVDAFAQGIHGWPIRHLWMSSVMWGYVTNNAGIKARTGIGNRVFNRFEGLGAVNNGTEALDDYQAEIPALPNIRFHVYNGTLVVNGTTTQLIPNTMTIFTVEPDPAIVSCVQGTEYVQENEMQPAQEQRGPYFWPQYVREPAKIELCGIDLFMPTLHVPNTLYPATTVF